MLPRKNKPEAFPQSNGHVAWRYFSKTIEGAAVEDLFWRRMQVSPDFVEKVVKATFPTAYRADSELCLGGGEFISLHPMSCGAYRCWGNTPDWLNALTDNIDKYDLERADGDAAMQGYFLAPLFARLHGWQAQNVVPNLMQAIGQELTVTGRFLFKEKACHHQVLIGKPEDSYKAIIGNAYPVLYGYNPSAIYWYKTETSQVQFGMVYFTDGKGNVHKLPLSAWQAETIVRAQRVYDMLNISTPHTLYDLDKIVRHTCARYAVVCQSEATVEYIKRYYAWIPAWWPVTTYAAIEATDWSKLKGKTPIIFSEATEQGCREAFQLHTALTKQGFKPRFLKRQKCSGHWSAEFVQDLGQLTYKDGECGLTEFAEHCLRVFGVKPPDGILPKAVALSDLPEPVVAPEILMDGLLDTGEHMMIHAWRGVGKSLFALLLALCFAAGKGALNGRVCPSRKYRVLLLDGEMSAHSLKKRARRLCSGHGLPTEAIADVKVRSIIAENKDLTLETEVGLTECMPDLMWADIIVVDSVFKFFHTAMTPEFSGAGKMLDFLKLCRLTGKTLILIDHEGKGRPTSFGTMGKEIALDVVLRLAHAKSPRVVEAHVQKVRDHAEPSGAYIKMRVEADNERITYQVCDDRKGGTALEAESSGTVGEAEATESSVERAKSLDEAINQYVREHPDAAQGVIVTALMEREYGGRSTIQARIKALSEAGKLPGWQNRPETHKVAEQPALEGDQN